jgi:molybdate transport system permease protein
VARCWLRAAHPIHDGGHGDGRHVRVDAVPRVDRSKRGSARSITAYEEAARTLGASQWRIFRQVTLPLVAPSLFAGAVLCWARALGEFGATITFAGNLPGVTQTLPLAVYIAMETRPEVAIVLSLVLLLVSLGVLVALRDRYLRLD